jgi:WD40 repeat protein
VTQVAFAPNGKTVLIASSDHVVRLLDAGTLAPLGPPVTQEGQTVVALSPDGVTVLTGGGLTARLWDASTGAERSVSLHHDAAIARAVFALGGQVVLTTDATGCVRCWDASTGQALGSSFQARPNSPFVVNDHAKLVLTARVDGTPALWAIPSGKELGPLENHAGDWTCAAFSPDGKMALLG